MRRRDIVITTSAVLMAVALVVAGMAAGRGRTPTRAPAFTAAAGQPGTLSSARGPVWGGPGAPAVAAIGPVVAVVAVGQPGRGPWPR